MMIIYKGNMIINLYFHYNVNNSQYSNRYEVRFAGKYKKTIFEGIEMN